MVDGILQMSVGYFVVWPNGYHSKRREPIIVETKLICSERAQYANIFEVMLTLA